jgi:hypothetical protein
MPASTLPADTIGIHQQYGYARSVCVFACISRVGKQTDNEDENVSKTSDAFVTLKRGFHSDA